MFHYFKTHSRALKFVLKFKDSLENLALI